MKKRLFALCFTALIVFLCVVAFAEGEHKLLLDFGEILDNDEYDIVLAELEKVSEKQNMDIVIVTEDNARQGYTTGETAMEIYETLGFKEDGVMLYINMQSNEWYLLTSGYGITAVTDAGKEYISDRFVESLSDGEYKEAFMSFIKYTDEFVDKAKTGEPYDIGNMPKEPYNFPISLGISVAIGLAVAFVVTGIWKSKLKSVVKQTRASDYLKAGSLNITDSRSLYLYSHIDRRERQRNNSSGGSTIHTSLSGKNFGGGGGKF